LIYALNVCLQPQYIKPHTPQPASPNPNPSTRPTPQQADLDIVTPVAGAAAAERTLAEAEVIKSLTQILDALPELGQYEVRINHR